ncbi:diacylglycerol kinase delta-like [Peromyscus eremicus]|nr:diacylglycerol kinase delta-like [Peromyscus eremicus]
MDQQLRKLTDTPWLCQPMELGEEENVMLDLSKRSRSGKFRLVTKFKKEKNNKNKEVHSSLGAPGPRRDQSGPHEEDPLWDQGAEPELPCRRGLASAFSACIFRSSRD